MVPVEKLLDAYAVFLWCHSAAASPAIPVLGSMTIYFQGVAIMRKCPCRLKPRQLSCIVAHEQPNLRALPAWHLPARLEFIHLQSLLLEVLHHK